MSAPVQWLSHQGYAFRYQWHPAAVHRPGPPVVFLSGAFQSMESWGRFVDVFHEQHDVLLVDLPGSGLSDPLPPEFDLDFLADALHEVLLGLNAPPAYLVCASYGSPIGYRFAQRYPDRVWRLVLAGVMDSLEQDLRIVLRGGIELAATGRLEAFADYTVERLLCHDPERVIARRRSVLRALHRSLRRMSAEDVARFVSNTERILATPPLDLTRPPTAPTLVFTGEHDCFTRPASCRRVARHIPQAHFTTLARSDHLFHLQRFDATVSLLRDFASGRLSDRPEAA